MFTRKLSKLNHLADIHIQKSHKRHIEYRKVFKRTVESMTADAPDRIIMTGDLFHDKLSISNEAYQLAAEFLNDLGAIANVIITRGNHDFNLFKPERVDCIQTVIDLIQNPSIKYLNKSGFYIDENLIYVVWHHGDHYSPWNQLKVPQWEENFHGLEIEELLSTHGNIENIRNLGYKFIDLYHDPINGCKMFNGMELAKDSYITLDAFKGDFVMAGDIHLRQAWDRSKKKVL
jgi:predicted MPP superfamily phosphohydrolase